MRTQVRPHWKRGKGEFWEQFWSHCLWFWPFLAIGRVGSHDFREGSPVRDCIVASYDSLALISLSLIVIAGFIIHPFLLSLVSRDLSASAFQSIVSVYSSHHHSLHAPYSSSTVHSLASSIIIRQKESHGNPSSIILMSTCLKVPPSSKSGASSRTECILHSEESVIRPLNLSVYVNCNHEWMA